MIHFLCWPILNLIVVDWLKVKGWCLFVCLFVSNILYPNLFCYYSTTNKQTNKQKQDKTKVNNYPVVLCFQINEIQNFVLHSMMGFSTITPSSPCFYYQIFFKKTFSNDRGWKLRTSQRVGTVALPFVPCCIISCQTRSLSTLWTQRTRKATGPWDFMWQGMY